MSVLVSGTSSGLGRFLCERLKADRFDRATCRAPQDTYNTIIHCAFNATANVPSERISEYVDDTISLTEWLLSIPHERFVFISSIAVYPQKADGFTEQTAFDAADIQGLYGTMKLICEGIVGLRAVQPVILRCAPMLGPYIRSNLLMRLISGTQNTLPVTVDSNINYILYEQIEDMIRKTGEQKLEGVFNVAASENATFGEIAAELKHNVAFGDRNMQTSCVSNAKAAAICPPLNNSTLENIRHFCQQPACLA